MWTTGKEEAAEYALLFLFTTASAASFLACDVITLFLRDPGFDLVAMTWRMVYCRRVSSSLFETTSSRYRVALLS
eukprot:1194666-Prorocentrum_minimum.AAC.7